jgi:hypothetical protein
MQNSAKKKRGFPSDFAEIGSFFWYGFLVTKLKARCTLKIAHQCRSIGRRMGHNLLPPGFACACTWRSKFAVFIRLTIFTTRGPLNSQRRYYADGALRHSIMLWSTDTKSEREIIHLDKLREAGGYESFRDAAPPCWSPDGKWVVSLVLRTKWVLTGRPGMEMVNKSTMALVFASPEKGVERQVDLDEKGVVFVGSIDWR